MPNLISPNEIDVDGFLDDYFFYRLVFINVLDTSLIEIEDSLQIVEATDVNFRYIKLINDENDNLSVLRLQEKNYGGNRYYLINKSYSFVQQKGYASILYEYCFCHLELPIISDKYQTKAGSSNLWSKLHRKINKNYEIFIYNDIIEKSKRLNSKVNDYSVWGVDLEIVEIYKQTKDFQFDAIDYRDVFEVYDPYTNIGNEYIHKQLEDFIKNGLAKRKNKKSFKQKVNDRVHLRLVGKKKMTKSIP
ncbi:hypothetical protein BD847_0062 [Flavobacterium cutihirudinis]|uniref:Uncharacterized protein n=1 Tax=Flavobacterium cutihirudinis TaxID=1265740 RepID=A0A3D9G0S8_9FLAO|nr:hypothetical protein [Flavobacterium cutihirudinis]RED26152.1 hypothetical protein BD847_0062 [Flavobacterium cutihirudinis]